MCYESQKLLSWMSRFWTVMKTLYNLYEETKSMTIISTSTSNKWSTYGIDGPQQYSLWIVTHFLSQDCFSMVNISWYGGASVHAPNWPINDANISMQPFTVSNLRDNPSGFGSVLERYFLGSSGKQKGTPCNCHPLSQIWPPCPFTLCWPVQTCIHLWLCTQF